MPCFRVICSFYSSCDRGSGYACELLYCRKMWLIRSKLMLQRPNDYVYCAPPNCR